MAAGTRRGSAWMMMRMMRGRLNGELRGLLGGRKYVKEKDLTREILLEYAKRQGAVTIVDLLSVAIRR
jgi:hypothetical protein